MNPKEKAEELFSDYLQDPYWLDKYQEASFLEMKDFAKECLLIAVDEKLKQMSKVCFDHLLHDQVIYWEQVKEEIQKL